jgi:ribosomal protein S18 acetylase RimI-like enzyme
MITIQPLERFDEQTFRRVSTGYTTDAHYRATKIETEGQTRISLDLVPSEPPYTKQWDLTEEDILHYREAAQAGLSLCLVNESAPGGEQVAGIALAEPQRWNRSLWIWEFLIAKEYQGQGLGRRLMDAMAALAGREGFRVLVCEVQSTNVPAIRFYRRVGFEIEGIDLSYYTNSDAPDGEVALFMKRKLE